MSMGRFFKSVGIFLGLTMLTFLGLLVGFQKISLPHGVMDDWGGSTLNLQMATDTGSDTRVSPPLENLNKKMPTPASSRGSTSTTMMTTSSSRTITPPKPTVSTPGPLIAAHLNSPATSSPSNIGDVPNESGALNQKDIMMLTNTERTALGLVSLTFNNRLAKIAEVKARDMINKQYFAHVSPDGTDVTMLAANAGYLYVNLGENLALGDFRSSAEVVTGWMNSPGHRANILNKNYTEIGIAAIVGNYSGRMVWYAVQEFGRPMPDCPKPDVLLEQKIALYETQITATEVTIGHLRAEIDTPGIDRETYAAKVNDYNTLVNFYNSLVEKVKADVATYNRGVNLYNICIGTEGDRLREDTPRHLIILHSSLVWAEKVFCTYWRMLWHDLSTSLEYPSIWVEKKAE